MICVASRELSGRIIAETGIDERRLAMFFDWLEGVLHVIRERKYKDFVPVEDPHDAYTIFTALVPPDTSFAQAGSIHEQLEKLELLPTLRERGIYHVIDEDLNWPVIGIRRS